MIKVRTDYTQSLMNVRITQLNRGTLTYLKYGYPNNITEIEVSIYMVE